MEESMNEFTRALAAEAFKKDPSLAETFEEFEASQAEFMQLLELMGLRSVTVEIPPASNSEVRLRANVSGTRR
jgi:hypothetical protein